MKFHNDYITDTYMNGDKEKINDLNKKMKEDYNF